MELDYIPLKPVLNRLAVTTAELAEMHSLTRVKTDKLPTLIDETYSIYESSKSLARIYTSKNYFFRVNQSILATCLFDIVLAFPVRGERLVIDRPATGWRQWVRDNLASDVSVLILDRMLVFQTVDEDDLCLLKLRYNEVRKS